MKKHIPKRKYEVEPQSYGDIAYYAFCGLKIRSRDVAGYSGDVVCGTCERLNSPKKRLDLPPLRRPEGYQRYKLGNWLRGFFEGYFKDGWTAWKYLSHRFYLSYPGRRHVNMEVFGENQFGFEEFMLCRKGLTDDRCLHFGTTMRLTRRTL